MRKVCLRVAAVAASVTSVLGFSAVSSGGDHFRRDDVIVAAPTSYIASPTSYVVSPTTYYAPTSYVSSSYVATSRVVPSSYSYLSPTSYSYAIPTTTSYVVPTSTSYVVPTTSSYVLPTAYSTIPTSYEVLPTTYYTTSYRRGLLSRLFSRPVIETTRTYAYDVTPTSYYVPTTISLDAPMVATGYSLACNETSVPFVPPSAPANTGAVQSSQSVTSKPRTQPDPTYNEPVPQNPRAATPQPADPSPPSAPVEKLQRPVDPPNDLTLPPVEEPAPGDGQSTTAFRPKVTELKPQVGSAAPNMLRGEIVSGLTGKALDGVQVVFEDPNHVYQNRVKTTNAQGTFEVFLPNGDWMIRVVDPAAPVGTKAKEYGMVTATSGRYLDQDSSPIYGLRISN